VMIVKRISRYILILYVAQALVGFGVGAYIGLTYGDSAMVGLR
jgi:hypothetical protein